MGRDEGLRWLGLAGEASEREVVRAYRSRALPLKTQVLTAPRVTLKDRYREDLRALVVARDAALGRPSRRDWRGDPLRVDGRRLLDALLATRPDRFDRTGARAFLGVRVEAPKQEVLDAYQVRARALVRCLANAGDDDQMAAVRRARLKLRTIRNFAL